MAQLPELPPGQVRPGGVYARYRDEWMLSTQTWVGHATMPWVELRPPEGGIPFRVPSDEIRASIRMAPEVEYAEYWFDLGSLWTVSGERLWTATSLLKADCFADLLYQGDNPGMWGNFQAPVC